MSIWANLSMSESWPSSWHLLSISRKLKIPVCKLNNCEGPLHSTTLQAHREMIQLSSSLKVTANGLERYNRRNSCWAPGVENQPDPILTPDRMALSLKGFLEI